jgi:hypothetical protein
VDTPHLGDAASIIFKSLSVAINVVFHSRLMTDMRGGYSKKDQTLLLNTRLDMHTLAQFRYPALLR